MNGEGMPIHPSSHNPLQNITAMVACSAKKFSAISNGLRASGASVLPFPVIEIREVEDKTPLDTALSSLDDYDWLIFTSAHGVIHFFKRFRERNVSGEIPGSLKLCAIGPATAKALNENGLNADLVPERFVAEGVLEALENYYGGLRNLSGCRILLPRAKKAREVLPKTLADAGAHVDIVVCYQTVRAELNPEEIRKITVEFPDLIVFTSSSTVTNTLETLGHTEGKKLLDKAVVAAIGPITADTLKSYGKQAEIMPRESTIASLIRAIEEYYSRP